MLFHIHTRCKNEEIKMKIKTKKEKTLKGKTRLPILSQAFAFPEREENDVRTKQRETKGT